MAQFCLVYLFFFSTCFGQPCAHHQEKLLYLCDNGICHSVWVQSGLLVGVKLQPADQKPGLLVGVKLQPADQKPPIQSDKYQCRIGTVNSPDDGHVCPKHVEKINKYTKQNCAPSWIYMQRSIMSALREL